MNIIRTRQFRRAATKAGPLRVVDATTGELLEERPAYKPMEVRAVVHSGGKRNPGGVCHNCGCPGLTWVTTSTGKQLHSPEGRRHFCP
jgi:hypothetical protein